MMGTLVVNRLTSHFSDTEIEWDWEIVKSKDLMKTQGIQVLLKGDRLKPKTLSLTIQNKKTWNGKNIIEVKN